MHPASPTSPDPPPGSVDARLVSVVFQENTARYDLAATLGCGQAFRWKEAGAAWEGVALGHWLRLQLAGERIVATTLTNTPAGGKPGFPESLRSMLSGYLRLDDDIGAILGSFPNDPPMNAAVAACEGLRLLRQDPWECLASFICSSTKQIVQIQQIVSHLAGRFGERVLAPDDFECPYAFPPAEQIALADEGSLRACKLGFRAPYLLATARRVADGALDLGALDTLDTETARERLMDCPGVGRKIADCVLLFGYGRQDAFPVDVWVQRALTELYFPRARRMNARRLLRFSATHFGPFAGYAQQYLFHYVRTRKRRDA